MIRLYNDDCMTVFKNIPDESIDCVVTDCPYHIVSGGCSNDSVTFKSCSGMLNKKRDSHGNVYVNGTKHISLCGMLSELDSKTYVKEGKLFKYNEIQFSEWLPELYRILKPGTHCYIMINPRNLKELQTECEKVGFIFQQLIVWDKGNSVPNKYYMNSYELILMLRKGKAKNIVNKGTKNILRVPNIMGGKKIHPTEKPVELMKILIENSTQPGETVIDPFMGAGSTGVACFNTGRNFIGIEIDENYFQIAEERIGNGQISFDTTGLYDNTTADER